MPEVINTTQVFINKFNRIPKSFPYKRVEIEPQSKEILKGMFPFEEIATFEVIENYYITIFQRTNLAIILRFLGSYPKVI